VAVRVAGLVAYGLRPVTQMAEASFSYHLGWSRIPDSSESVENHARAVSVHFMRHNFARPHQTLGKRVTLAMGAGIERHSWSLTHIAELLD
jgi:hypothetical protein